MFDESVALNSRGIRWFSLFKHRSARTSPMALSFLFFPEEPEGGGIWISTL